MLCIVSYSIMAAKMAKRAAKKGSPKKAAKKIVKKTKPVKVKKAKVTLKEKATAKASSKAAKKAAGQARAAAMKKKGLGIFAPKTLSPELASLVGKKVLARTEVTKAVWAYIKAKKLNAGRIISPDANMKKVFPVKSFDMLKMAGFLSAHIK